MENIFRKTFIAVVMLVSLLCGIASATDIVPVELATIYGTVYENSDVQTLVAVVIEGALITASAVSDSDTIQILNNHNLNGGSTNLLMAYTDVNGQYRIEGAAAGQLYLVTASKDGYESQTQIFLTDNSRCLPNSTSPDYQRCDHSLDFSLTKIPVGGDTASLAGTVYEAGPDGTTNNTRYLFKPLAGATVEVYLSEPPVIQNSNPNQEPGSGSITAAFVAITDDQGHYEIAGLTAGKVYVARASKDGYLSSSQETVLNPGHNILDFELVQSPQEQSGAIFGTVSEGCADDQACIAQFIPIAGAEVVVTTEYIIYTDASTGQLNGIAPQQEWRAITDQNGNYRIEGLPLISDVAGLYSGNLYQVSASKKGYQTEIQHLVLKGAETQVNFSLIPQVPIPTDSLGTIFGRVAESDGIPSNGVLQGLPATITVMPLYVLYDKAPIIDQNVYQTVADANGYYKIGGIPLFESYLIVAELDGYQSATTHLYLGSAEAEVNFQLFRIDPPISTGVVSGTITQMHRIPTDSCNPLIMAPNCVPLYDIAEIPVAGAVVTLSPAELIEVLANHTLSSDLCLNYPGCMPPHYSAVTDEYGQYKIGGVPIPGLYYFTVEKEGFATAIRLVKIYEAVTVINEALMPFPHVIVTSEGGIVESNALPGGEIVENVEVVLPQGAIPMNINLEIAIRNHFPIASEIPLHAVDFTVIGFPGGYQFNQPVRITLPYPIEEGINEDQIVIRYLNEQTGNWEDVGFSSVDKANHSVSAWVTHFSTYGVFGGAGTTGIGNNPNGVKVLSLTKNTPNPFKPSTLIQFQLNKAGLVKMEISNAAGQVVRTLAGYYPTGLNQVKFDGKDAQGSLLRSGVYFLNVQAEGQKMMRKMTLLK